MSKVLVFGGYTYYPLGGFEDHVGTFDNLGEAIEKGKLLVEVHIDMGYVWMNIMDVEGNLLKAYTKDYDEEWKEVDDIYSWKQDIEKEIQRKLDSPNS